MKLVRVYLTSSLNPGTKWTELDCILQLDVDLNGVARVLFCLVLDVDGLVLRVPLLRKALLRPRAQVAAAMSAIVGHPARPRATRNDPVPVCRYVRAEMIPKGARCPAGLGRTCTWRRSTT